VYNPTYIIWDLKVEVLIFKRKIVLYNKYQTTKIYKYVTEK